MKAQFFIISSVIIIYIIVLSFQYLTVFSDIRVTGAGEQQDFYYIEKIKNSFVQAFNISNYTNKGDLNMIAEDMNFNKKFSNQELLKRGISFDSKFIFFSNGFETGFDKWTSINGNPEVDSDVSYDGEYSLYCNSGEYVNKSLPQVNKIYARVYINFSTLPLISDTHYFMGFYKEGNQILNLGIYNDNNILYKLRVHSNYLGKDFYSDIKVNQGEWHYFELYWYENGTNSNVKAWYDGNLKINNITDSQGKSIDEFRTCGYADIGAFNFYVDCVAIGSDYIGGDCYPDAEPYFVFSLKTKEMYTKTGFPYQEEISPLFDGVLWLKFDEGTGTTAFDSSTYNNIGTFYGETFSDGTSYSGSTLTDLHTVSGKYGNALSFDGVNDFANVSDSSSLDVDNITITAWIYPLSFGGGTTLGRIVDKAGSYLFYVANDSNQKALRFYIYNSTGSGSRDSNSNSINLNAWQHVAVTYDSQTIRFYVNGVLNGSGSISTKGPLAHSSNSLYVGDRSNHDRRFNGTIDELRIWNRTLSQAEIQAEMNSSMPVSRPALSYSFEESGNYIIDTHIWVKGNYSSALSFDGSNDYVNVSGVPANTSTGAYNTVAFWMYWKGGTDQIPFNFGNPYYDLWIQSSTCMGFNTGQSDAYGINPTGLDDHWVFIALVFYNGAYTGNNKIYINGVQQTLSQCAGSAQSGYAGSNVFIGRWTTSSSSYFFNGMIDEVRIWNIPLSASEILNCYQTGC